MMEICLVPKTKVASQYPGLYIFTGLARMMRPVTNLALNKVEMIGTFEQVYMDIAIVPEEMEVAVSFRSFVFLSWHLYSYFIVRCFYSALNNIFT